jgi:hypothetical protein
MLLLIADRCTFSFDSGCNPGRVWPKRTLGAGVIALGLGVWAYGAIDAVRIVKRENADNLAYRDHTLSSISPMLQVPAARGDPWTVGIHASW